MTTLQGAPPWQPPDRFDEYVLVKPLGRGRTGFVYVAQDTLLERHVAVKFIPARDEGLMASFVNEARTAARIQHPNVATLYRVGRVDGHAYLVWELVRGKSLDQVERPVLPERVLQIAVDTVRGLGAAHRRAVLHRDIKPGNIVVSDTGESKLVDFGLATMLDAKPRTPGTDEGLIGTPYFMSPEAWLGDALDVRSDLYSLGLVLYELLAGEGPFRHVRVKELAQVIQDEPPRPLLAAAPTVPEALASVIDKCLRRDRAERFASADELLAALDLLSPTRSNAPVPVGNPYRGLRAYDAEHRALFFGRTRPLRTVIERLRGESFLVVTGDSGVGKSSLCAAGALPAVAEGALEDGRKWIVGRTVPGRTPIKNLVDLLARLLSLPIETLQRTISDQPGTLGRVVRGALRDELALLVYIDQLEELVTQPTGQAEAVAEALASLADGLPGVRLLATARSDFLSRLAGLPGLGERLPPALMLLGPMSPADVREAIVGPAALKQTGFESEALVEELVDSTTSAQGSLPLLQFTLAELWELRDASTGVIAASSLAAIGGVSGALARHADAVLVALGASERAVARSILLRLVSVDDTRTRRTEDELRIMSPLAPAVLDALVRGRLLVVSESPDGAVYEIAHEALVRGWSTLAHWLTEEAELRAARHRLETASIEWGRLGRSRDLLWSGRQLGELDPRALEAMSPREQAFVEASRRARKVSRWVRRGIVVAVALAIVGTWLGAALVDRRATARAIDADLVDARRSWDLARGALRGRVEAQSRAFAGWDGLDPDAGERAWKDMQQRTQDAREQLAATAGDLERAMLRDADRSDLRELYADLLLDRVLLADVERRRDERAELVARLALYDADGSRGARLDAPAQLVVDVTPSDATLELANQAGAERRSVVAGTRVAVAAGSWLVTLKSADQQVRTSIELARGENAALKLAVPAAGDVPPGFIYIPPGQGYFGSADAEAVRAWFNAVPLHVVQTGGYVIAQHETTFAEWIEFLDDLPVDERERRRPRVAGTGFRGMLELSRPDGRWQIALQPTEHMLKAMWGESIRYPERDRRALQDWRRMPVSGVSYDDAVTYSLWLHRTGRVRGARMCTEHEWERAGRGTFHRNYPHGDVLAPDDANVDETYRKKPGGFGPDEVGSHPASTSVFGVADLTGNVWEWVSSSVVKNQVVARGGSYYFSANTARLTNRELPEASYRDLTVGVRICASR